jgi:hypothetical protein
VRPSSVLTYLGDARSGGALAPPAPLPLWWQAPDLDGERPACGRAARWPRRGLPRDSVGQGLDDAPAAGPVHPAVGARRQVVDLDPERPGCGRAHRLLVPTRARVVVEQRQSPRLVIRAHPEFLPPAPAAPYLHQPQMLLVPKAAAHLLTGLAATEREYGRGHGVLPSLRCCCARGSRRASPRGRRLPGSCAPASASAGRRSGSAARDVVAVERGAFPHT